jgi:magnesium transporter
MLQVFVRRSNGLIAVEEVAAAIASKNFVWADLCAPADSADLRNGEAIIEAALGLEVPTPSERRAFEESARFYEDRGALYLTATLMGQRTEGAFVADAVTFILHEGRLVTVRAIRPRAFTIGESRSSARIKDAEDGGVVLMALVEGVVERIADVLQEATSEANRLSAGVFVLDERSKHRALLRDLGTQGTLAALCRESLASLQRLALYAAGVCEKHGLPRERFEALGRDVSELERQADALQAHLGFLMQAALGLVGAAQNNVLRTVALATIALTPATLIASIFGMNFKAMTWFAEPWGPWVAGALMIAMPAALFTIARWRKWF